MVAMTAQTPIFNGARPSVTSTNPRQISLIFYNIKDVLSFLLPTDRKSEKTPYMNMKTCLASLLVVFVTSGALMSATETERLRALCEEQEMQIRQLEEKIARLTDTPPASRPAPSAPAAASDSQPVSEEVFTYTVKSGDSIERIARKNGTTAAALANLNGLKADSLIHPDQKLKVPGKTAAAGPEAAPAPAKESRTHTVVSGETFYKISMKYGVTVDELMTANPNVNHKALKIGQKIKVDRVVEDIVKSPVPGPSLSTEIPILSTPESVEKPRASDHPVRIEIEITYGEFAAQHGTTTRRLDELNGYELDPSTVLARGSELYIPAQP
jgi:LysM repeat protein